MNRMIKNGLSLFIAVFLHGTLSAQVARPATDLYKADAIPDSLKRGADAVVRYELKDMVIKAPGKLQTKVHRIVTILNDKADDEATLVLFFDKKFNSVSSAQMTVYNALGTVIKKYDKGDMYEHSAADGISIITDDRLLVVSHEIISYPITIETVVEQSMNSFLDLPDWTIQKEGFAIQSKSVKVAISPETGFRYRNANTDILPVKGKSGTMDTYSWEVHNLSAVRSEADVPDWKVVPRVSFATNLFEFAGMPGDISSWKNFGSWIQQLNTDVSSLTPQREEEIRQMTATIKTDKEKAKFLYEYMQQNMRYVSIQLGVGGLKPFPAMFVDQKKYGDCKALSNYMYALLKAVNIPSYYALINAGENEEPADPSFSNDPFNHIILCIPFKNDTTWLECTSNTRPFGKLGTFTENRNALLITPAGGVLKSTPRSTMDDNRFSADVAVVLDGKGGATAKIKISATGEYRDMYLSLSALKTDDQKEYLIRSLNLKQPYLLDLKHSADKNGTKEMDLDLEYDKFCDIMSGDKQFYKPSVLDLWRLTLPAVERRTSDYYFSHPLQKTCTTTIALPADFQAESLPANTDLKFSYGTYKQSYTLLPEKNQVSITSTLLLTRHVIPAANYSEMQQFMELVAKAQNKKLIIRKKS